MKLFLAIAISVLSLPAAVIEGTVLNSVTGVPVIGVGVSVESAGKTVYQAATDALGQFRLEDVKPGIYTAEFSKKDFLISGADAAVRKPFSLQAASGSIRLDARLTPFGTVQGHVLNANREPIAGAELLLNGSRLGLTSTSNDQGEFSFQAAPGRYVLLARAPASLPPPLGDSQERLGWIGTYYPGVTDSRDAAPIVVRPGSGVWALVVRLQAAPMRRVHGKILGANGSPAANIPIRATRTDEPLLQDTQAISGEDGAFEFPCLYDGEWVLSAQTEVENVKFMAVATAQVSDHELDGLELRLNRPFSVRGSISVAGGAELGGRIGIILRPATIHGWQELSQGSADAEGNFAIDNVYPGTYKVIASFSGLPVFLASIRMGDRAILGQYVPFEPGSPPVEIVLDTKGGQVRGKLDDCGSGVVVLVPQENLLQEPQFVQAVKCREGGNFEIYNLRPGDYYGFAFSHWEGPLELLAGIDRDLINQAVSVHVNRGETAVIELRATVRDR